MSSPPGEANGPPPRGKLASSRRVCLACRARRIRCDLSVPRCGPCARNDTQCSYQYEASRSKIGSSDGQAAGGSCSRGPPPRPNPPSTVEPGESDPIASPRQAVVAIPRILPQPLYDGQSLEPNQRSLDRRLLAYFVYRVEQPDVCEGTWVPRGFWSRISSMGSSNPFIMHAMLSIGASTEAIEVAKSPALVAASHTYIARSLTSQITEVRSGINPRNYEVLFTNSILLATAIILQRAIAPFGKESLPGVVDWFRCWTALRTFAKASSGASQGPFAAYSFGIYAPNSSSSSSRARVGVGQVFSFLLTGMPRMSTPRDTYMAYQEVVTFLETVYASRRRPRYTKFLGDAPARFVRGVGECEPTALVLMGVYFGLTRILDSENIFDVSSEADLRLILANLPIMYKRLLQRALDLIGDRTAANRWGQPAQGFLASLSAQTADEGFPADS